MVKETEMLLASPENEYAHTNFLLRVSWILIHLFQIIFQTDSNRMNMPKLNIFVLGYMAGRKYTSEGSGVDSQCLPEDPVWGNYHDGDESNSAFRAYIYGAEIDTNDDAGVFPYSVNEQDMSCAVCKTNKSMNVMIPARNMCYSGWTEEYHGYLMAGSHSNKGHTHICMDGEPEFLQHGGTNDNEHIMYLVDGQCGSLPCPPYVQGRELTCVVCSQ